MALKLELSAAFDTINHAIVIMRMAKYYGFQWHRAKMD